MQAAAQRSNKAIVFFDIETGGFVRHDDILQISMKCGRAVFNRYSNATKPISPDASAVHGLTSDGNILYHRGIRVKSSPLRSILIELLNFLQDIGDPCILVAHNCKFDSSRLLIKIKQFGLLDQFRQVIVGFADSLSLFKKRFPNRTEKGSLELTTLAIELINVPSEEAQAYAHDAMYDVELLEKLVFNYVAYDDIIRSYKSFNSLIESMNRKDESTLYLQNLKSHLDKVVSKPMLERMASARITFESMLNEYKKGDEYLIDLLEQRVDGIPQIIKQKRIIDDILSYLRQYVNHNH